MSTTTTAPSAPERALVDEDVRLDEEDLKIIKGAPRALKAGVELKQWWEGVDAANSYENRFDEALVHHRPEDKSFGFFETAQLGDGKKTEVIGNVQQQLFHRPKAGDAEFVKKQIREFVLRYFMRISDYRTPQPQPEGNAVKGPLKYLSWFPGAEDYKLQGFGYSQRYFKKRGSREVRKFEESKQSAILDLRDIDKNYEWTLIRNPIVDFSMNLRPLGVRGPDLTLPIPSAANWLVMSPDTITIDESKDESPVANGVRARYGIGYSFMKDAGEPGMFAYGPGQLEPTVQTLIWEVRENGDVIVRMSFVSAAPTAILNFSANPLDWGFMATELLTAGMFSKYLDPLRRAANLLPFSNMKFDPVYPAVRTLNLITMGAAGSQLGISREELNKTLTYAHFVQHYNAVLGSRQTWEMFPDWTAESKLPDWIKSGDSA